MRKRDTNQGMCQMLVVKTLRCFCCENLQDYVDFQPFGPDSDCFFCFLFHLSLHSIHPRFPYDSLRTVPSSLSKSLPNGVGGTVGCTRVHIIFPRTKVTGAERVLTVSHSETPSCARCCGLI